jgi:hypothetical protein
VIPVVIRIPVNVFVQKETSDNLVFSFKLFKLTKFTVMKVAPFHGSYGGSSGNGANLR